MGRMSTWGLASLLDSLLDGYTVKKKLPADTPGGSL